MKKESSYKILKSLTTLQEVLDVAMDFERTARDFYTDLIPKVSKNLRYLVEALAKEEQRHFDLFESMAKKTSLDRLLKTKIKRPASDHKFFDCIHVLELGDKPDDQEILQYALMREHAAMKQYEALACETPAGPLKDLFKFLAIEKTKHKNELEAVYYEIVHSGGV